MRKLLPTIGLLLWSAANAVAAPPPPALPCTLVGKGMAAVTLKRAAVQLPTSANDCSGARVTDGEVIACLTNARGQPVCRPFAKGEVITAKPFGQGTFSAFVAALNELLRGNPGTLLGQSRGSQPALLPSRTVLLLERTLLVDFAEPALNGVDSIEIRRDGLTGPLLGSAVRTPGTASIAVGQLPDGPTYWTVLVPAPLPTQTPQRFNVASLQERQSAQQQLDAFERQGAGPLATAMMRAAWLAEHHYEYDALATMKAVGLAPR